MSSSALPREQLKVVKKQAKKGDAEAQYRLARHYHLGDKTGRKDPGEALRWYTKSAAQNHPGSMLYLFNFYKFGDGVTPDIDIAMDFLSRSAEANNPRAQYNLGICLRDGDGIKKNLVEAFKWFVRGAENGNPGSYKMLGNCYYTAAGVERNLDMAVENWLKAVELGDDDAKLNLKQFMVNHPDISAKYKLAEKI